VNDAFINSHDLYLKKRSERIRRVGEALNKILFNRSDKFNFSSFHLEIGCGHGHWLTSFAQSCPNQFFIGIDLITRRLKKAEQKKRLHNLENVFFIKADALEFLEALPKQLIITSTYLMFPDPWPKKRHHKKRLIQTSFLNQLSEVSQNSSSLFLRTDHHQYFEWSLDHIKRNQHWRVTDETWPHEADSFFQKLFCSCQTLSATVLK